MPYSCQACGKKFRYKVTQRTHKCQPHQQQQQPPPQPQPQPPVSLPQEIKRELTLMRFNKRSLARVQTHQQNRQQQMVADQMEQLKIEPESDLSTSMTEASSSPALRELLSLP